MSYNWNTEINLHSNNPDQWIKIKVYTDKVCFQVIRVDDVTEAIESEIELERLDVDCIIDLLNQRG